MKKVLPILLLFAGAASAAVVVLNTFNSGELSGHLDARIDFAKYQSGCRTMENFIPLPYGGAMKRPGTQYITGTQSNYPSRLIPFSVGVDQSYIVEMGHNYMRFYADGAQIMNPVTTNTTPLEVLSPYGSNDVFDVQFVQSADVMYFTHPDYPVFKLTRTSTTPEFTGENLEFDYPPLLDRNETDTTIGISAGSITNTAVVSFYNGWGTKYVLSGSSGGKYEYVSNPSGEGWYWDGAKWNFWAYGAKTTVGITSTNDVADPTKITSYAITAGWANWRHVSFSSIVTNTATAPDGTVGYADFISSSNLWTSNHVGSVWVLEHPAEASSIYETYSADATSSAVRVKGTWRLITQDNWNGKLTIQVSDDGQQTWTDYREYISDGAGANFDRDGIETENGVFYRLVYDHAANSLTVSFKADNQYQQSLFEITGYTSATQVTGRIYDDWPLISTNATKRWYEGAFNGERGYPRTCSFFENRLWFGGTEYEANRLWASKVGLYEDFETGTNPDDGMKFTLNSDNVIMWLLGANKLYLGTLGDEWVISGEGDAGLTPETAVARRQSAFGSQDGMGALLAGESVFYLQRNARRLRDIEYSLESDIYKSIDTTVLANHVTDSGIKQTAWQSQPEPVLWAVRNDGQLIGLTYSKEQNIFAWHRHVTDGDFESVATIPSQGEDRIYVVVKRTVNGESKRYIEWFTPQDWGNDDDAWFVDSGLDFDGGDAISVTAVSVDGGDGSVLVTADNAFEDGWLVEFDGVSGMTELENYTFGITNATTTNFNLTIEGTLADGSAWAAYTGTGTVQRVANTFTNLAHLAGKTLDVFADGGVQPDATVDTNGVLVISDYKNRVIAGLPYTARLSPMYIDVAGDQGTSYGRTKQIYRAQFRVKDSGTFQYGTSTNNMFKVSVREPNLPAGSPVPFYTGDIPHKQVENSPTITPQFWIVSNEPLPLELLSMALYVNITEIE